MSQALLEAAARTRVLVIGSLNVDLILEADSEPSDESAAIVRRASTQVGGHAGNCASALATLGMSVSLVAAVGTDADGDLLLADLCERGIDVRGVRRLPGQPTGRVVIPVFGDKHYMLLCRGANDFLAAEDVQEALRESYDAVLLFDPSREALLAVDTSSQLCWTPGGIYSDDAVAAQVLPRCEVVFVNRAEHRQLSGHAVVAERTQLVMTLGAEGSLLRHNGREWRAPARPVPVVDPTGAGDAYAAAYVLALLAGLAPADRLVIANSGGALAVSAVGARGRLATLHELIEASS